MIRYDATKFMDEGRPWNVLPNEPGASGGSSLAERAFL